MYEHNPLCGCSLSPVFTTYAISSNNDSVHHRYSVFANVISLPCCYSTKQDLACRFLNEPHFVMNLPVPCSSPEHGHCPNGLSITCCSSCFWYEAAILTDAVIAQHLDRWANHWDFMSNSSIFINQWWLVFCYNLKDLIMNENFMKMIFCWMADVSGGTLPAPMGKSPLISVQVSN